VILVAGGTGLLGSLVVTRLSDRGERVRVLTRDPGRARHLPGGVETVTGDVREANAVVAAMDGCDRVVSAVHGFAGPGRPSPAAIDREGNHNLITAAVGAGVARFVLVSALGAAPDHPMSLHRMKFAAEQELWASTIPGVIVRSAPFLETWLGVIGAKIAGGGPALVLGRGRNPINFASARDVAAFVDRALRDDQLVGETISVGGPENLSFNEIAARLVARGGGSGRTKHVPTAVLGAAAVLARPVRPVFARQARAAVVMNTIEMSFDAMPTRLRFPDIALTAIADVVADLPVSR